MPSPPPTYHDPVLLHEAVNALHLQADGIYADVTFGGGGHARAILAQLGNLGKLYAFDQDPDATQNIPNNEHRLTLIPHNFRHIQKHLRLAGVRQLDGIIADLGVSWHQFNTDGRGFSIRFDHDLLDMRMNPNANTPNATDILKTYSHDQLVHIFQEYGELPSSKRLATAIVESRRNGGIQTVGQLKKIAEPFAGSLPYKYLAQLFQALRMEVNEEVETLKELLLQATELLKPQGRLVIIAYHSIEDRIVKNFIKKGNFDGKDQRDVFGKTNCPLIPINSKVIVPSPEEIARNPKSRSAKMRIAEKI